VSYDYDDAYFCHGYHLCPTVFADKSNFWVGMLGGDIWFEAPTKEKLTELIEEAVGSVPEPVC
jgi:hypothetical protein